MRYYLFTLLTAAISLVNLICGQEEKMLKFPITKSTDVARRSRRFLGGKDLTLINSSNQVYMLNILVGTGLQKLQVQLDTGSYVLWFASPTCNGCGNSYPHRYNCQTSDSCNLLSGSTNQKDITFGDGTHIYGTIATVPIQLPDGTQLTAQHFLYVTKGLNIVSSNEDGIFGLGPYDPYNSNNSYNWVNTLYQSGAISSNQFSMYLTNVYNKTNQNSMLMLGSVDTTYIKTGAETNSHKVTSVYYWTIKSSRILFGGTVVGSAGYDLLIDSGTSFMSVPTDIFNDLQTILVNQYQMTYDSNSGVFFNNCDIQYPTFSFEVPNTSGKTITYTLEPEYYAVYDSISSQCGIVIGTMDGFIILGDVFMQKYVSTFVYGSSPTVSLTQSITSGTTLPFLSYPKSTNNDFPNWAKIVIPIVAVIILGAIIIAAYTVIKRRNLVKRNLQNQQPTQNQQQVSQQYNIQQQQVNQQYNNQQQYQNQQQFNLAYQTQPYQTQQQQNINMYPIQQQQMPQPQYR